MQMTELKKNMSACEIHTEWL